jgi:hypothetical protein
VKDLTRDRCDVFVRRRWVQLDEQRLRNALTLSFREYGSVDTDQAPGSPQVDDHSTFRNTLSDLREAEATGRKFHKALPAA